MNIVLKDAVDQLFHLCESEKGSSNDATKGLALSTVDLNREFVDYLSYLSASDGSISECDADFLFDYFDLNINAAGLRGYVEKNNTYTVDFESKVPETLKKFVQMDNAAYLSKDGLSESRSLAYIEVFELVGKEFLSSDGDANEQELIDFSTYIRMLKKYVAEHSVFSSQTKSAIDTTKKKEEKKESKFFGKGKKEKTLEELLDELNQLIGLQAVKSDVNSLIHLQEIKRLRLERGLREIPVSNHLVFYGNPGTGKTTVARLLAEIYHVMGILSKGQFTEVDRSGLVAGYVGQTALKVQEVVKKSLGGVLFIDEAYALTYANGQNDYGQEAVDTLLKAMEDHRDDFIVIVAGYPEQMAKFIDSNPGLRSRFNKHINFEDYNVRELSEIFEVMCENSGYQPTREVTDYAASVFEQKYANRGRNFANAREVRNFFEKAILNQADRLFSIDNPTDEQLCTLELSDVQGLI